MSENNEAARLIEPEIEIEELESITAPNIVWST
jgi:hypothetical protein